MWFIVLFVESIFQHFATMSLCFHCHVHRWLIIDLHRILYFYIHKWQSLSEMIWLLDRTKNKYLGTKKYQCFKIRIDLTMSSGPSQECLKGISSGTILLSIISMSSRTSGSQFSFMARLADVWRSWMCIKPTENWASSGS